MYLVPMMCTMVSPLGGSPPAGAEVAGVLVAAVVVLDDVSVVEALAAVLDASLPIGAVDVEARTSGVVVVSVIRATDDDASTWAEASLISKMLTNARLTRARALIPATEMMFVFIICL